MRESKIMRPELVDRVIAAICSGCTYRAAASAGPVSESVLHDWRRRGERDLIAGDDTEFARFVERIGEANATAERLMTEAWVAHFPKDWRAVAEFMSRRYPQWRRADADWVLTDDERADALADRFERFLIDNDVDVPPNVARSSPFSGAAQYRFNGHQ